MKAVVLLCAVAVAVLRPVAAGGAPASGCDQIVQQLNNGAAAVADTSSSYWAHRANFVDLIFGSSRDVPNARQMAEQEKAQADPLKTGMPNRLASFKGLVTAAQAQGCLSPAQLSAITEPTTKLAKRVNFDQFPPEVPIQSTVEIGPPEMPH